MKRSITATLASILLVAMLTACEVRQTGDDTYQVEAPTETAEQAGQEVVQETTTAVQELGEEAGEAAQATEEAARDAAHATGTALEKAGREVQQHSKPGDQP